MPGGVVCDLVITEAREPIVQTAKDSKEMDPDLFKKAWWHVHSWMAADIEARKRQTADKLFKRQLLRQSFSQWFQNTDFMPALGSVKGGSGLYWHSGTLSHVNLDTMAFQTSVGPEKYKLVEMGAGDASLSRIARLHGVSVVPLDIEQHGKHHDLTQPVVIDTLSNIVKREAHIVHCAPACNRYTVQRGFQNF